jgi:hypothetical protein
MARANAPSFPRGSLVQIVKIKRRTGGRKSPGILAVSYKQPLDFNWVSISSVIAWMVGEILSGQDIGDARGDARRRIKVFRARLYLRLAMPPALLQIGLALRQIKI